MAFELIVEPGIGVGSAKLGMTPEDLVSLGIDLHHDGFRVSFGSDGRCKSILVNVFNNKQPVLPAGHDINDISATDTRAILAKHYGSESPERDDLGLCFYKWELSDDFYTFVGVRPGNRNADRNQ